VVSAAEARIARRLDLTDEHLLSGAGLGWPGGGDPSPNLRSWLAAVERMSGDVMKHVRSLEAETGPAGDARQAVSNFVDRLRAAEQRLTSDLRTADRRAKGVSDARKHRLAEAVRPLNRPQERILSMMTLAARHGVPLVRGLALSIDPFERREHLFVVGGGKDD
jgi:hypothetical protein